MVDEGSLPDLTMRRLATRLRVDPMALYRHVANKEALLRLVSDLILAEVLDGSTGNPDMAALRASAIEMHEHLVTHPGRLAVLAASATTVSSAAYTIRYARALIAHGVDEQRAAGCLRALVAYVFGAALLTVSEQADDGHAVTAADVSERLRRYGDPVDTDSVERLLTEGMRADVEDGIDAVIRGFMG